MWDLSSLRSWGEQVFPADLSQQNTEQGTVVLQQLTLARPTQHTNGKRLTDTAIQFLYTLHNRLVNEKGRKIDKIFLIMMRNMLTFFSSLFPTNTHLITKSLTD